MSRLVWLIPLFPLLGSVVNALLGRVIGHRAHWIAVPALGASFLASCALFARVWAGETYVGELFPWIAAGTFKTALVAQVDQLSAVMLLVVTGVGLLIHLYSAGYMHGDPGYARYFAYLNLFVFSMVMLVLAGNFLVLYVFWEAVGLCSYLLIGFWYERKSAAEAGKKAFIVNRVGDFGFGLGVMLIWVTFGTLDYAAVFAKADTSITAGTYTAIALLLFMGACGKSAQGPLFTWLPDAMEGPTPVSALIHAATMVTAGVYMVARCHKLFEMSPIAFDVVAWVGGLTAVFAATIALAQTDIKRVLAYSTISQLGYMFVGVGVGAYAAGIFHLVTHAFFKALLFLGAGSVIHGLSGEQDLRKMGGLKSKMLTTTVTFLVGALGLAGVPPLAGFFSKDEILWFALASGRGGSPLLFAAAALTALLTAFYMFRLLWLTFLGAPRMDAATTAHVHESPPSMIGVLIVLAVLSAIGGFLALPHYLEPLLPLPAVLPALEHFEKPVVYASVAIALAGLAGAAYFFGGDGKRADALVRPLAGLHRLLSGKYFVDEAYDALIGRPLHWISERVFLRLGDQILLDGSLNGLAGFARRTAGVLGRIQTGNLQLYAFFVLVGLIASIAWSWRHG
jgi:NADH-quinone oxidoreductase subunit L